MDAGNSLQKTAVFALLLMLMAVAASAQNLLVALPGGTPANPLAVQLSNCTDYFQAVNLTTSSVSASFSISVSYAGQTPNWLSVSPTSGTAGTSPTQLNLGLAHSGLSSYPAATVTINPTSGTGAGTSLTVVIISTTTCGANGTLALSPSALSLNSMTTTSPLNLSNGTSSPASYTASTDQTWLTVSPTSGTLAATATVPLSVSASATGLSNGSYTGHVNVSSGSSTLTTTVTFTVSGGNLTVGGSSAATVSWSYTTGSSSPDNTYAVHSATGASSYSYQVTTASGGSWLLANYTTIGSTTVSAGLHLTLSSVGSSLVTGVYQGTVSLTSSDGGTATVTVTLTVNGGTVSGVNISPGTSYTFVANSGSTVPQSTTFTVSASAGTILSTPTSTTYNGGSAWLTINTTAGGTSSESIQVTANPSNLANGSYTGSITVPSSAGSSSISIALTVGTGGNTNTLSGIAPSSLSFAYQVGASASFPSLVQYIAVTGSTASYSATADQPWISLEPSFGIAPGNVGVYVYPGSLAAGTHTGNITITSGSGTTTVPVSLLVTDSSGSPVMGVFNQGDAVFYYPNGTGYTGSFVLTASDGSTPAATAVVTSNTPWLSASLIGTNLTVTANASSYGTGTYTGTIAITSASYANSPLVMPVVLVVGNGGNTPGLSFNNTLNQFNVTAGGPAQQQTLNVTAPNSSFGYTLTVTSNGGNWLTTSPVSGSSLSGSQSIIVTATPGNLVPGTYTGTLAFNTSGNTQTVNVSMVVGGSANTITATASSLSFAYQVGGTAPAAQSFNVTSAQGSAGVGVTLSITPVSPSTATWLSASFANSTTTATTPATVNASINTAGLAAGNYSANIVLTPGTGNAISIGVALVVLAAPAEPVVSASPTSLTFNAQAGANAQSGSVTVSGGGSNAAFTATAAMITGSGWLSVAPTSGSTGTSGTTASVKVDPSNLTAGSYTGTVTIAGTNGATGSTVVNVSLTVTAALPTIAKVVSAASYANGPLSPGEIVAIFSPPDGSHPIGPATAAVLTQDLIVNGQLPTTLGGVQVFFNGTPAPLFYAGALQVNAIVPYGVGSAGSVTALVKYQGQSSNGIALALSASAPAIFTVSGGTGATAALNTADYTYNGPTNPATKGSIVEFFVTGEGATSPASLTGQVTPVSANTPKPIGAVGVTIDGQPALVNFWGEAPGEVAGLLQLNVTIPANARTGDLPLLVNIGGNYSQAGVTISVK
jgi:uncharacterized protein (TIGR03437 family)